MKAACAAWREWCATEFWYDGDKMTRGEALKIAAAVVTVAVFTAAGLVFLAIVSCS